MLVPVAWLEGVPWLTKCVLRAVVRDSSPGPYSLDHLFGFSVLYRFGLVLVVVLGHRRGDDHIQDTWCKAVQEEAYGFLTSNGVTSSADKLFKVGYVLVNFWEAHPAFVEVKSSVLLIL